MISIGQLLGLGDFFLFFLRIKSQNSRRLVSEMNGSFLIICCCILFDMS